MEDWRYNELKRRGVQLLAREIMMDQLEICQFSDDLAADDPVLKAQFEELRRVALRLSMESLRGLLF